MEPFFGYSYNRSSSFSAESTLSAYCTPEGKHAFSKQDTTGITDLVRKLRLEIDADKQRAMIHQVQCELALQMPYIHWVGYSLGFSLTNAWLENFRVFNGAGRRLNTRWWYNKAKDPKVKTS